MIINYNGMESFKIQSGGFVLAFNPISKKSKLKQTRFGADITCISVNHPDFDGLDQTISKNKKTFSIDGAGEYEVEGIFIKGYQVTTKYEGKDKINTIYSVVWDGMSMGFLGILNTLEIDNELKEILSNIDILFVPIGGGDVLDASQAYKLSLKLGVKLIIPMCYKETGEKDALKSFLKESGSNGLKAVKKITLKSSDLSNKEGEVVVLEGE
ncbi:MAG: MBL fold metallo-hydrolase [Patescibacteria group bacterium]|nr:MBL fold metallo-hydrolase [Patescibacteria group bacterium]